jgi:hypothetical protein
MNPKRQIIAIKEIQNKLDNGIANFSKMETDKRYRICRENNFTPF